jgi:hypothetical protein
LARAISHRTWTFLCRSLIERTRASATVDIVVAFKFGARAPLPSVVCFTAVEDYHCSFCGKRRREVRKLISGPRVFICDECVALCVDILAKTKAAEAGGVAGDGKDSQEEKQPKFHCSFCGKSQGDVEYLIAGPTVYLCDACVDLCVDIIEEDLGPQGPRSDSK